ncbi:MULTISPECIES: transporter substrate-binding domain-containing protein [Aliivibrio]|uniref:Transporter substrate-binding domain-containing protein n=1 Tax=Aliivibrio finisterrensis TaxID=511998 RepID=A0A4Q5KSZ3_9GAMM|nr:MULTISPECIES: transporter substrate-binding domain-containing protein [Aliivibrio]MDD9180382.1 transporter substrate-binding domain-containing protein [Aliivibrio sp. A6]RYU48997.1 transporter substrate-binding domain-containing protein [Aliivibrio finisterrensis]RYU49277.1 transporter substrate-binding domain-containing protein [Aliivibrio finisterrensis]RYU54568.1 transporter substrate-binding domain-containing protein [Aliivibrio finisterrensis]RYU61227.1 transporter substrate-binding do
MYDEKRAFRYCVISMVIFVVTILIGIEKTEANTELKVGTYHCPPFIFHDKSQEFEGLSMTLWLRISEIMKVDYSIQNYELDDLLLAAEKGDIDVGVSCISITPDREEHVDFSHSFYETHLAITVKNRGYLDSFISIITNKTLWKALGIFFFVAISVGAFYYFLERKNNDKLYSMPTKRGRLAEAFILGVLFITKGPFNYFEFKTLSARIMTVLIAMFSTVFIASITAILASSLTLEQLRFDVKGVNDLSKLQVGAKQATTTSLLLTDHSIAHETYPNMRELLVALDNGDVDAIVADDAVLRYMIKQGKAKEMFADLVVLPYQLEKQNYGLVLVENSEYEEEINRALLQIRETTEWHQILLEYFTEK